MRILDDLLDFVLLIVILAMLLPVTLGQIPKLRDTASFGFTTADDKTMKNAYGPIQTSAYWPEGFTAAELLLITRVANKPVLSVNTYRLPDGTPIVIDYDYRNGQDAFTQLAKTAADKSKRYHFVYNYSGGVWEVKSV